MTYTDDELKEWFKIMKNKYPNSKMYEHLKSVEFEMFNKDSNNNLLKIKIKKIVDKFK